MNYKKVYYKLIKKAKQRAIPDGGYIEYHHIFPISVFGKNNKIVALTYKEHVFAHHLLFLYFKEKYGDNHLFTIKMAYALHLMVGIDSKNYREGNLVNPIFSLKAVVRKSIKSKTKEYYSGKNNPFYGKYHTIETKRKISESLCGDNNPNYGKKFSAETRRKMSDSQKGENNHMYGKYKELNPRYDHNVYTWYNEKLNIIEHLTPYELTKKYNLNRSHVSALKDKKAKSHKGWKLASV